MLALAVLHSWILKDDVDFVRGYLQYHFQVPLHLQEGAVGLICVSYEEHPRSRAAEQLITEWIMKNQVLQCRHNFPRRCWIGKAGPVMCCVRGCTGSEGHPAPRCPSAEQAGAKISSDSFRLLFGCQHSDWNTLWSAKWQSHFRHNSLLLRVWSDPCTKAQLTQTWRWRTKCGAIMIVRSQIKVLLFFFPLQDNHRLTCH